MLHRELHHGVLLGLGMEHTELKIFQSEKSTSTYVVSGTKARAYIRVTGEAMHNRKVQDELARVRRGGCDMDTAEWTARMLSKTY